MLCELLSKNDSKKNNDENLQFLSIVRLVGIVLLSISFGCVAFCRSRTLRWWLDGVENFLVYRSVWKYVHLFHILFLTKESLVFISLYFTCRSFHMCFFLFSHTISYCRWWYTLFAIGDLWPWLWNSLNTLIFTRAHLTMRYIALFLIRFWFVTNIELFDRKLIWSGASEKNHQNNAALSLRMALIVLTTAIHAHQNDPIDDTILLTNQLSVDRIYNSQQLKVNCIVSRLLNRFSLNSLLCTFGNLLFVCTLFTSFYSAVKLWQHQQSAVNFTISYFKPANEATWILIFCFVLPQCTVFALTISDRGYLLHFIFNVAEMIQFRYWILTSILSHLFQTQMAFCRKNSTFPKRSQFSIANYIWKNEMDTKSSVKKINENYFVTNQINLYPHFLIFCVCDRNFYRSTN